MRKKLLILFAAACLAAGSGAVLFGTETARAEETADGNYTYSVKEDGTVCITDYKGSDTEIEVPAVIDGKQVTEIGYVAFYNCGDLTEITVPEGVTQMGKASLQGCKKLVSIHLPASLRWLGQAEDDEDGYDDEIVFDTKAGRVFDGLSSLTDIHVASGNSKYSSTDGILCVKFGKDRAVMRVPEGKSGAVTLPEGATQIRANAFKGCSQITEVTFTGGMYAIRDGLKGCDNLTKINLSADYEGKVIQRTENDDGGTGYFRSCSQFVEYSVAPDNQKYAAQDGILYNKDKSTVISCPVGKSGEIILPQGVVRIGRDSFGGCSKITKLVIPDGTQSISGTETGAALDGCSSLASIEIPASMKEIGEGVLPCGRKLKDIYFKGSQAQWDSLIDNWTKSKLSESGVTVHCSGTDAPNPQNPPAAIVASDSFVTLAKTSVIYNGKAQMLPVTVKDGAGKAIDASNYTVTYGNNKNVGQASVTVAFKGNYKGTVTKAFDIVPNGTSISKAKAGKKSFTVKWKKQKTQTTGYEIRYSTNKKMKKATVIKNIKAKKTSQKVSKLKAKKTYYVQIRTYKTVKGKKYVSEWSKSKSVRTKK